VLGLSAPTVSRLRSGGYRLEPGSKPFELGQLLVRLFRSLDGWLGGDDAAARSWLSTLNLDLGGRPIDLIAGVRGLVLVGDYADGLRAPV